MFQTLILQTANRETVRSVCVVSVDDAATVVVQGAEPGTGPERDGRGPPTAEDPVVEISVVVPKTAREGSKARRIRGSCVW